MLGSVLSKESCAKCKFCCAFRRQSLWELPRVSAEFAEKYSADVNGSPVKYAYGEENGVRYAVADLSERYGTDDPEEEVPCPFLDPEKGCVLPDEDKPFDCKIWPFRYMKMQDGAARIVMADSCPEMQRADRSKVLELVDDKLGAKITEYATDHPYFTKQYHDGYSVIK